MILTQQTPGPDVSTSAIHDVERPAIVVQGSRLDFDKPQSINIRRRFFAYGGQELSLEHDLLADAYLNVGVLRLKGWNIEICPAAQSDFNLDREILRKFLSLYAKAEAGTLSDSEREDWASIVTQVDYQRFCAERSPEVYVEGTLLCREEDGWRVRWHDGTEQFIQAPIGKALDLLEEGEHFGALVNFGKERAVRSLSGLSFTADRVGTSEELWQSWPVASS
jgi:hypothetical protein